MQWLLMLRTEGEGLLVVEQGQLVPILTMIMVDSKSSALSMSDASKDTEFEESTAKALPASRRMFTMRLTGEGEGVSASHFSERIAERTVDRELYRLVELFALLRQPWYRCKQLLSIPLRSSCLRFGMRDDTAWVALEKIEDTWRLG